MSLDIYLTKKCQTCGNIEAYSANITHNLTSMAAEAGIYNCLWRARENGFTKASQLIDPLEKAIVDMKKHPEKYKAHNSKNGWGLYENFLPWIVELLENCKQMPDSEIETWR